jgi:hypothetical protein
MRSTLARRMLGVGSGALLSSALLAGTASAAPAAPASSGPSSTTFTVANWVQINVFDAAGDEVAFAKLTMTAPSAMALEVCNLDGDWTDAQVNPADASGNATGDIIDYIDDPGGGCYTRTLGYPIRKFRVEWVSPDALTLYTSDWALPPAP